MRDELIELLTMYYSEDETKRCVSWFTEEEAVNLADYILADGWTKPIYNVGDILWVVYKNKVYPVTIYAVRTDNKKNNKRICVEGNFDICEPYGNYTHYYRSTFNASNIGKSIFFTKEEAEQALRKEDNGK